jgi:hypothetical protein
VTLEPAGRPVSRVRPGPSGLRDCKATPDPRVLPALTEQMAPSDPRVLPARTVRTEQMAPSDPRVLPARTGQMAPSGRKVRSVPQGRLAPRVQLVHKARRVIQVPMDRTVRTE